MSILAEAINFVISRQVNVWYDSVDEQSAYNKTLFLTQYIIFSVIIKWVDKKLKTNYY